MALRCPNTGSVCQGIAWPYSKYGLPVRYPLTAFWNMYWDTAANGLYTSHFMYGSSLGTYSLVAFYSALHTPVDFAIGMDGNEVFSSSQITGRWARQAVRSYISGGTTYCDYFYDLPDLSKVIQTSTANAPPSLTSNFAITIGANNWTDFEGIDGRFSDVQIYTCAFPNWAIAKQSMAGVPVLKQYLPTLWAYARCGSVNDIRDLSGNGRHPVIYTGSGGAQPTSIASPSAARWTPEHLLHYPYDAGSGGGGGTLWAQSLL